MDIEKELDKLEQRNNEFKNELSNVIRLADNIQSVVKDTLEGHATKLQCRSEITKYANEIIKRLEYR